MRKRLTQQLVAYTSKDKVVKLQSKDNIKLSYESKVKRSSKNMISVFGKLVDVTDNPYM